MISAASIHEAMLSPVSAVAWLAVAIVVAAIVGAVVLVLIQDLVSFWREWEGGNHGHQDPDH